MYKTDWYYSLNKPLFSPPEGIFAPVWSVLYLMMAVSLVLFLSGGMRKEKISGLSTFIIQLILNFSWSYVFFGAKNISLALAVIILMWTFILITIILFYKQSKIAAILLIPYLLWVSFALYLNLGYLILN